MALILAVLVAGSADGESDSRQVLKASDVLAKIGSGEPVEYSDVIIEGDLNPTNFPEEQVNRTDSQAESGPAKKKKMVSSSIKILGSEIRGQVDFSNVIFLEQVDFKGTNFTTNANFSWSQFRGDADFNWSQFRGDANFSRSQFSNNAYFSSSQFNKSADFYGTLFSSEADFRGSKFSDEADFRESRFSNNAYFSIGQFNRSANFSGAMFSRDAKFDTASFSNNAYFSSSQFNKSADFYGTLFSSEADFRGSQFSDDADFRGSKFSNNYTYTYFSDAQFNGNAKFDNAGFIGDLADFADVKFNKTANFETAYFRKTPTFVEATFNGDVNFVRTNFSNDAIFNKIQFVSDVSFEGANFSGDAEFNETQFHKDADFSGSRFNKNGNFVEAQFDADANFKGALFNETVTFEEATFCGYALFEGANFSNTSTLCLNRTQCDKKIRLKWRAIEGDDKLPIVWWDDKDSKLVFDEEAYLTLYKNYRDLGWFEDANKCYYEYMKHRECESFTGGCINTVLHVSYGYGTKPEYSLYWSVALMAIFGVIWSRTGIRGSIFEADSTKRGSGLRNRVAKFANRKGIAKVADPYLFSAKIFLSGTKLFVDPPKYRKPPGWRGSVVKTLFISERTLGMILFFLFIFAISASMLIKII